MASKSLQEKTYVVDVADSATVKIIEKDLYAIMSQVFEGEQYATGLCQSVATGALGKTTIRFYYDSGRVVGLAMIVLDEFEYHKKPIGVVRLLAGFLPEYRGSRVLSWFFAPVICRYFIEKPRQKFFVFSPVLTAPAYSVFARIAPTLYPNPNYPTPPDVEQMIQFLMDRYHFAKVPGAHPFICSRGAIARSPEKQREPREQSVYEKFFLQLNGNFREGNCLVTCAPASLTTIPAVVAQLTYHAAKNALRGFQRDISPRLTKTPNT